MGNPKHESRPELMEKLALSFRELIILNPDDPKLPIAIKRARAVSRLVNSTVKVLKAKERWGVKV